MWKVEFLVGLDSLWANVSASTMKRWRHVASLKKRLRNFFCKKIDRKHLITMPSATVTLFPSYTLTSKSEELRFPPF